MSQVTRKHEIRRRRKRRATLRELKRKMAKATSPAKLEALMKRFRKVCGAAHLREFTQQMESPRSPRKAA